MTSRAPDSPENPHAGQGCVLLDIGDDIGALVVTTPLEMVGAEVEIAPAGALSSHRHHQHAAVVRRPVQDTEIPSLVFADLAEGRYELAAKGSHEIRLEVDITGGHVTWADWPTG